MDGKEKLQKAFDSGTAAGKLVTLREEQATEFITYIKDESAVLKAARVETMTGPNKTIAKLFIDNDFLYPGDHGAVDTSKDAQGRGDTVELKSELLRGNIKITDQEMQDNIEGGKIGDKFMRLLTAKIGNELEKISIYSRKRENPLKAGHLFNGFKYRGLLGAHQVDASLSPFSDRYVEKKKFIQALKSLPTIFRTSARWFISSGTYLDYSDIYDTIPDSSVRNELRSLIWGKPFTQGNLISESEPVLVSGGASTTTSGSAAAAQKVIPVTSATGVTAGKVFATNYGTEKEQIHTVASVSETNITMVDNLLYVVDAASTFKEVTLDGTDALLTDPRNLIYGIQTGGEGIQFEIERIYGVGWRYHFKIRVDFQVENTDALVLLKNYKIR